MFLMEVGEAEARLTLDHEVSEWKVRLAKCG
jgi:hypothetical protein